MCIRGPCRVDRDQADRDVLALDQAAKDGVKAVRECAAVMKRARIITEQLPER